MVAEGTALGFALRKGRSLSRYLAHPRHSERPGTGAYRNRLTGKIKSTAAEEKESVEIQRLGRFARARRSQKPGEHRQCNVSRDNGRISWRSEQNDACA